MDIKTLRLRLLESTEEDEPVPVEPALLAQIDADDLPRGVSIWIGTFEGGVMRSEWEGQLLSNGATFLAEAEATSHRKYWSSPLGIEPYIGLIRAAVEQRHRSVGDVELTQNDADDNMVFLTYLIRTNQRNADAAYRHAITVRDAIEASARSVEQEVERAVAAAHARLASPMS
jgi:hypothetical protein